MKRIFLATLLSFFALAAMAQFGPTFIVSAGYQGANIHVNDKETDYKMKSGFRVGVAADLPVYNFGTGELSIQPGIYYSTKGAALKSELGTATLNLGYVELPILANVRFGVTNDVSVFVNAGPYLAYGVNSKVSGKGGGFSISTDENLFKKDGPYKPFDAGAQVGAGVEYRRIQLGVGGQFGFVNMFRSGAIENNEKSTNSTFFVSLGYRF